MQIVSYTPKKGKETFVELFGKRRACRANGVGHQVGGRTRLNQVTFVTKVRKLSPTLPFPPLFFFSIPSYFIHVY